MVTFVKSTRELSFTGGENRYINTASMMTSGWWDFNMKNRVWSDDLFLSVLLAFLFFFFLPSCLITLEFSTSEEEEREVDLTFDEEGEGLT